MDLIGAEFGEIELVERLETKRLGELWRGKDRALRVPVALHVLDPKHAESSELVNAFVGEARLCARLQHENIVRVFDIGRFTHQERIYRATVLDFVEEGTITRYLQKASDGCLELLEASEVSLGVARALTYLHRHGVTHGRISPDSVLIGGDNRPRIADFLHARIGSRSFLPLDDAERENSARAACFMAPELLDGEAPSYASDVYALGALLGLLISGKTPFDGLSLAEILEHKRTQEFELPETPDSEVGKALTGFVQGMTRQQPSKRLKLSEVLDRLRLAVGAGMSTPGTIPIPFTSTQYKHSASFLRSLESDDLFVGRTKEFKAIEQALEANTGLVTLHGMGGMGKTRSVKEFAKQAIKQSEEGTIFYFVSLSTAQAEEDCAFLIAESIGLSDFGQDLESLIIATLESRQRSVLILDNAEHVVEFVANFVEKARARSDRISFIVTSREVMNIRDEVVVEIAPLSSQGRDSDALRLFRARAKEQRLALKHSPAEEQDLVRLLEELEGIPLAIELMSANADKLAPSEMLELVKSGARDKVRDDRYRPSRQETMHATIAWSWGMLTKAEQYCLAQLAVFKGSFSIEAAEAVVEEDQESRELVIDLLESLTAKALISTSLDDADLGETRFKLLTSIRSFAIKELPAEALSALRIRHRDYYFGFMQATTEERNKTQSIDAINALSHERSNISAAIERSLQNEPHIAGKALLSFDAFEISRVSSQHLGDWFREAADAISGDQEHTALRIDLLLLLSIWQVHAGDGAAARSQVETAENLAKDAGLEESSLLFRIKLQSSKAYYRVWDIENGAREADLALELATSPKERSAALYSRGVLAWAENDPERSLELLFDAETIERDLGHELSLAMVRNSIAISLARIGRIEEAVSLYRKVQEVALRFGNKRLACIALYNAAGELSTTKQYIQARAMYREVAKTSLEVGLLAQYTYALGSIGQINLDLGEYDKSEESLRVSIAVAERSGDATAKGYFGYILAQLLTQRERAKKGVAVDLRKLDEAYGLLKEAEANFEAKEHFDLINFSLLLALCALYSELSRQAPSNQQAEYRGRARLNAERVDRCAKALEVNIYKDEFLNSASLGWIEDAKKC